MVITHHHHHHRVFNASMISDAVFVLVSKGPSIKCGNGPFLPDELHDFITLQEYSDLVHSLDEIFSRTHWPVMPLFFFVCCLDVCAYHAMANQRRQEVHHLLDTLNVKLAEKGLHWQPLDCDGYVAKLCVNRYARQAYLARNGITVSMPTTAHSTPSPSPVPVATRAPTPPPPAAPHVVNQQPKPPTPVSRNNNTTSPVGPAPLNEVYIGGGEPAHSYAPAAPARNTNNDSYYNNSSSANSTAAHTNTTPRYGTAAQKTPSNYNLNAAAPAPAANNARGPPSREMSHQQMEDRALTKKRSGESPMAVSTNSTNNSSGNNLSSGAHTPLGTLLNYAASHNYQDVNVEDSGDINYDTRGNESEYRQAANAHRVPSNYNNTAGRPASSANNTSNSNMVSRGAPGGRDVNDYYYGGPSASAAPSRESNSRPGQSRY